MLIDTRRNRAMVVKSFFEGRKDDTDKPRWDLLPWGPVSKIVDVLTFGAKKYADNNWQKVPNPKDRYFAALMRHLTAWRAGSPLDPETGLHHLAHAACCVLFLLWFDMGGEDVR